MSAILVSFWTKSGERKIRHEVLEVVPRIGERVSITSADGMYVNVLVLDVCHVIPKPSTDGGLVDVRINVLLDLE